MKEPGQLQSVAASGTPSGIATPDSDDVEKRTDLPFNEQTNYLPRSKIITVGISEGGCRF